MLYHSNYKHSSNIIGKPRRRPPLRAEQAASGAHLIHYIYIYIYRYIEREIDKYPLSLSLYTYIQLYIYIYIYTYA